MKDGGKMSFIDRTSHIPKFGGEIWYINKSAGDNGNSGTRPDDAFETIGAGIAAMGDGDALTIKAGTYTETGLNLSNAGAEMWFDIGAVLDPASGTCLTVSGNYCRVTCREGALKITPATNQTGVLVTGQFCYLAEIRVSCFITNEATSADIGFDIGEVGTTKGSGCDMRRCRVSSPDVAAFKIQGDKVKLENCCTGGGSNVATYSSIGFWMTNSCDKTRVKSCGSQGHGASSFQVDTGCTNGVIENCYSGGGDGKWTDADDSFIWSSFSYPETKYATQTFAGGGGGSTNLFKVIGTVEIMKIYGHVITALNADVDNLNLEFDADGTSVDITSAVDVSSAPVGSFFLKNDEASEALVYESSAAASIIEAPTGFKAQQVISPFILNAKAGSNSYITADYSGTATNGAIHWHIEWKPLTDDGFVEPA